MRKVRITVLKKEFDASLVDRYLTDGRDAGTCPLLEVGDTFVFAGNARMPEGFGPWAWIDLYRVIDALSAGASYSPWYRRDGTQVYCCTDGIRPVVFLLEAMEECE